MQGKKQGEINLNKYYLLNDFFNEGKIIVRNANNKNSNLIVLDKTGKKLFEIKNSVEDTFVSGKYYYAGYMEYESASGRWGVVDNKGQKIIRPKYKYLSNLGDGLFEACKDDGYKWGIINYKDEVIADFKFESYRGMVGDKFIMEDENSYVLVGKNGEEIVSFYNFDIAWEPYVYVDEQTSSVSDIKDLDDWDNEDFNGNRRGVEIVEDDDYIAVDTVVAEPAW